MPPTAPEATQTVADLRAAWFAAPSTGAQQDVLDALVAWATGDDRKASSRAASALIELGHLAGHPRAKVRILRAMSRCIDHVFVVPALVAELQADDPAVVAAALDAIGLVGVPFGGGEVLRWLDRQRPEELPQDVLSAALLSLARVGIEEAAERVEEAWRAGLVSSVSAHLALAEAVSSRLAVEAIAHLLHPDVAGAAALHLAALHRPELPELLAPLLVSGDPALALLGDNLLRRKFEDAESLLLSLATEDRPPLTRRRLARTLRVFEPGDVVTALQAVLQASDEPGRILQVALLAGIPELQDAALAAVEDLGPEHIIDSLRRVHTDTAALRAHCAAWLAHPNDIVAGSTVRALVSVQGRDAFARIAHLADSPRTDLQVEWARAQQNALRFERDANGRSTLGHTERQALARQLRALLQPDRDAKVREMTLYVVGNIGLTDLVDDLVRVVRDEDAPLLRRAAATSLAEVPVAARATDLAAALAAENEPIVIFRLLRALLEVAEDLGAFRPAVLAAARARLTDLDPSSRVLALALVGRLGEASDLPALCDAARDPSRLVSSVAITALGRLGDPGALPVVLDASRSIDTEHRCRAAEALGGLGGELALDRVVDLARSAEEVPEVRAAAIGALERVELPGPLARRCLPASLDDPFALPLFSLHLRSLGATVDVATIDGRLEDAVEGLKVERLHHRYVHALRALRTAELFYVPGAALPEGFDASPPVLYWAKGLELWLNDVLGARLRALAGHYEQGRVERVLDGWSAARGRLAPSWRDDLLSSDRRDSFRYLGEDLARYLGQGERGGRSASLRVLAASLILCGDRDVGEGLTPWRLELGRSEVVTLANHLVALAHERNRLTHAEAGEAATNDAVRKVALVALRGVARLRR